MLNTQPPPLPLSSELSNEIRTLIMTWGACCFSPLVYLMATWMVRSSLGGTGLYPLSPSAWTRAVIILAIIAATVQLLHLLLKRRFKPALAAARGDNPAFVRLLTRRTYTLILLSELPVFLSFCLFVVHHDLRPIFGFGIISMMMYAQSHPRSANPLF